MSPEVTAALYGAAFGGTFTLLGVVIERLLRLLGRLRCEPSGWRVTYEAPDEMGGVVSVELAEEHAVGVTYRCDIDLFNGKEVPTGLRDVRVELIRDDGRTIESRADDLGTGRLQQIRVERVPPRRIYDKLDVLNIPPRQFVHKELRGRFGREEAVALATGKWQRVEFVGQRPKRPLLWRKTYRKTITEP